MLISAFAVLAIGFGMPQQVKVLMSRRTDITAPVPVVIGGAVVQQSLFAVGLAAADPGSTDRSGCRKPMDTRLFR